MRGWGDRETRSFNKSLKIGIHQELREQSAKGIAHNEKIKGSKQVIGSIEFLGHPLVIESLDY